MADTRRFPAPWSMADTGSSWAVSDASGFTMVWFCYDERRPVGTHADRMTRDEARRLAANFVKLPELLKKERTDG